MWFAPTSLTQFSTMTGVFFAVWSDLHLVIGVASFGLEMHKGVWQPCLQGISQCLSRPLAGIKRAALQQGRNGKEGTEMVEKGRRGFIRLPPISGSEARATPSISDNLFFPVHFGTAQSQKTMVPLYGYVSKHFTVCDSSFCGLVVATLIISYEQCINWHWYHFISKNEKSCLGACQPIACRLDKSYRFHDIQQYVKVYCSKSTCFANTVAKHSGVRILVSVLIQQSLQPSNLS